MRRAFPTEAKAFAAQSLYARTLGIFSGVIRRGDKWYLFFDPGKRERA